MLAPCPLAVPQLGSSGAGHDPVAVAACPCAVRQRCQLGAISAAAPGCSWLGQWKFQGSKLLSCGKHLPHHPASLKARPRPSEPPPARALPRSLALGPFSASPQLSAATPRAGTSTCGCSLTCPGPRWVLTAPHTLGWCLPARQECTECARRGLALPRGWRSEEQTVQSVLVTFPFISCCKKKDRNHGR